MSTENFEKALKEIDRFNSQDPTGSRGGCISFQDYQSANIVDEVLQSDFGFCSHNTDGAHEAATRRCVLRIARILDCFFLRLHHNSRKAEGECEGGDSSE